MKADIDFTPEQEAAVKQRGGALLVSAAAGSGKTRVLVERLIDRIGEGDDVNEFLVITYTRAAATELRERIYEEIMDRLAENPENRRLRRQSILCRSAAIGTIHSLCADILRENAHSAKLAPDFRVADENESDIIKASIVEDILNEAYETIDKTDDFRALVDAVATGRDDKRLAGMVLDIHSKLQSDPNPRAWVKKQIERLSIPDASDLSGTVWGKHIINKARHAIRYWNGEIARLRVEIREHPDFDKAYGPSVDASMAGCAALLDALDKGWEAARECGAVGFPRPKPIAGYDDLKDIRKKCKEGLGKSAAVFTYSSSEYIEDMHAVAPAISALLNMILDFDDAYSEEKRSRGIVDFSDLEHLTLSLLLDSENGGKTKLAQAIASRYKEIMIDEYQDVNAVQERIFNALSQDEKNIFMVGDVKQSIYRFRLADPSIFLAKYEGVDSSPALVLLSKNFRSRAGILGFVNFVFGRIMSKEFGEMDYSQRERLVPGREDDGEAEPAVELDIIDMGALEIGEDEESPAKVQIEARYIAQRISELVGGAYMIPGKQGGKRPVEYSDIVILLRSMKGKAWQFAAALSEYGIPTDIPGSEGFFSSIEVSAALSLLSVIDNPLQDIPLAAALRGPVYGFSADELAAIRSESRDTDFYGALVKAAATNEKCAAFLGEIDNLRTLAPDMPADRLIWRLYNETGLLGRVGAMKSGARRRNNLILLAEYARRLEQSGYKGLFGFLTYMRGLEKSGAEPAGYETVLSPNAVRIMSIHKSKGLEFPIVFIADTSKQFNYSDMRKPLVFHTALGVGIKRIDRQRLIEYPTIARLAIQSKLKDEMLAEELRVLYVAMTRAREKLIITAVAQAPQNAECRMQNAELNITNPVAPLVLEDIKSVAGWLIAALERQIECRAQNAECRIDGPEAGQNMQEAERPNDEHGSHNEELTIPDSGFRIPNSQWDIRLVPAQLSDPQMHEAERMDDELRTHNEELTIPDSGFRIPNSQISPSDLAGAVDILRERFSFVYPYKNAPDLPSKLTVTELKGRSIDFDAAGEAGRAVFALPPETGRQRFTFGKPGFITEKTGLSAAERGTALHLAMQYLDFKKCADTDGVIGEVRRLADIGLLTGQQAEAVDVNKITRFFKSEAGERAANAENMKREFQFSLLYPAERFFHGGGDDEILLQGVIDCYFEESGELTLVDFKTDSVTEETIGERASGYIPQLSAYSEALERITGKRVKERVIYFFEMDTAYYV